MSSVESSAPAQAGYQTDEAFALALDAADPLAGYRDQFHIPPAADGSPSLYFASNSLGLMPRSVRALMEQELAAWEQLGLNARFMGASPWYPYHELFRETGARLVGARPGEVVMMNALTVNLHLLMVSFYRPTRERFKVLTDYPTFPSDTYAVQSQIRFHGFDPEQGHLKVTPRAGEDTLRTEDIEAFLEERGREIAVVLFSGVNFITG